MGKSFIKRKKEKKQRLITYVRYCVPFAVSLLMALIFSLPCLYFTDYTGDVKASTSIFARISENFSAARKVLLDTSVEDAAYLNFSSLAMSACVVCTLLFVIGTALTLLYMITGLFHLSSSDKNSKLRRLFVTFIPNKIVLIALSVLTTAPAFFPTALVKIIDRTLMVYTRVHYIAGDIIIYCAIIYVAAIVFFLLTQKYETQELNIFAKQKKKEIEANSISDDEEEGEREGDDAVIYRMSKRSREEQAENLRKLLNKKENNDNE